MHVTEHPLLMSRKQFDNYLRIYKVNRQDLIDLFLTSFGYCFKYNKIYSINDALEIVLNTSQHMRTILCCCAVLYQDEYNFVCRDQYGDSFLLTNN